MSRHFVARKWVAALVLTLGVGTVWGVVAGLTGSIVGTLMPAIPKTSENVVVATDGTPLVQSRIGGNHRNTKLRRLDGLTIELEEENWLGGASFAKPYREPGLLEYPISWRRRIAGCSDLAKPPANWLLMRDDRRPGRAYFTGFDTVSKHSLGFIGRRGYRSTVPPADEQFDLGNQVLSWGSGTVASSLHINFGSPPNHYYSAGSHEENRHLAGWLVFLLDGNVIQEIDLRNHKVRPFEKLDGIISIGIASLPLLASRETDDEAIKPDSLDLQTNRMQSKFRLAAMQNFTATRAYAPIDTKRKTAHRLLARCTDRIVALNPFDGSQQEFPLPQELQQKRFTAYTVADDQLLLQVGMGNWEHGSISDLLWINTSGEVVRTETLRLAGHTPGNEYKQLFAVAAVAPTLLPWVVVSTVVAPLSMVQSHQSDDYVAGLGKALADCWPVLLLIFGLSVALTLLVRHWQKEYCRDNTLLWCATVFATTVPGLLAYWLMHRGTVIEPCGECSQSAPRDRDACPHCEKPYAAPTLLGTEILV